MDIDFKIARLNLHAADLQREVETVSELLEKSTAKTQELLAIAASVGTTVVSIGKKHPLVENEDWPWSASGSIFTPKDDRVNGTPAAWHIARRAGVEHCAGNTGQHQVKDAHLIDGVYECRDGQWARIDIPA